MLAWRTHRFYNETKYSGLETNIQNSYTNPLLQLYKYTPRLRNVALFHAASCCSLEECLLCQMGFLFDMLEKASGQNCQATNLLKTLSLLPNGNSSSSFAVVYFAHWCLAARLGVLEDDSSAAGTLTMMMQNLNRFLLDQIIYDLKNQWPSMGECELPQVLLLHTTCSLLRPILTGVVFIQKKKVLLIKATKRQQCTVCHKETRPMGDTVTTDLIYSPKVFPDGPSDLVAFG